MPDAQSVCTPPGRVVSLDIFRGLAIAGMILVNSSVYVAGAYAPLVHATWDGWTLADTIFPAFLWIVGFSLTLSTAGRLERGADRRELLRHASRRALILFGLGLILQPLPSFALEYVSVTGVLQKIAVSYLTAVVIFLSMRGRGLVAWIIGLQGLYLALMIFYPVPGCLGDPWARECNFASFINEAMRQSAMWFPPKQASPDGVWTWLSATTTVLFGVASGQLFRRNREPRIRILGSVAIGCGLILGGWLLNAWIPINKPLWTTSYVVFMAGVSTLCFGACIWIAASRSARRLLKPFEILGLNAIAAYALAILGSNVPKVHVFGTSLDELLLGFAAPANASLLFALANLAGVYAVVYWMYRRGWYLKL